MIWGQIRALKLVTAGASIEVPQTSWAYSEAHHCIFIT